MYTIIMGVDENEQRAINQARDIVAIPAPADEIRVEIVHDFTENPEGASVHQVASVRRAREILEEAGIAVNLRESSGDPAGEIVDLAGELDADLINVAGRKRTPAGKVIFGSVTQSVILHTDRAVLVSNGEVS